MANTNGIAKDSNNIEDEIGPPESFKLENLRKFFTDCLQEDGSLLLEDYIKGYDEIYKFLCLLGTVYGWVASDVSQKNIILRSHLKGKNAESYRTIQGMVQHEMETKMVQPNTKHKDGNSGARNLLRLHRALAYVNAFLESLPSLAEDEKCCPHSQKAYKKTLSRYHPWVVQKAAMLAMNMLPTRKGLIQKICGESEEEYQEAVRVLPEAVKAMQAVYNQTQKLYEEHKLLDIP